MGVALGYSLLAYDACARGLGKLEPDSGRLVEDLNTNWEVLAEPIQTIMKRHGIEDAYEQLKALTRGKSGIDRAALHGFIAGLAIPPEEKQRLLELTPQTYTGLAQQLAKRI
jgi:adenylosuccinate lyase